jgi:hypothetical protein
MHPHPRAVGADGAPGTSGAEVGVASLFNPAAHSISHTFAIPCYYTGVTGSSLLVSVNEAAAVPMPVERDYFVLLPLTMPPSSVATIVFTLP